MLRTFSGNNIALLAFIIKPVVENTCSLGVDVPITVFRSLRLSVRFSAFYYYPIRKDYENVWRIRSKIKNKYENFIFVQNRFRRRGNFEKFHCVGGAAAAFISYWRRRRLSRSAYTSKYDIEKFIIWYRLDKNG